MSGQGISQILVYAAVLVALSYPLGLYMARVYGDRFLAAGAFGWLGGSSAASAESCVRMRRRSRTGRATARRCSSSASSSPVCSTAIQRLQGHLFLNPDHMKGGARAPRAEHDRELHHEHELAVLRRRVHDVVPHPDGRARGAELRVCGVGMAVLAAVVRCDRAALRGNARQLLGRPLPVDRLHPLAPVDRRLGDPDLAGRAADVPRARDGRDASGRAPAVDRARACCVADRDQAARHERRRLLQLELGRPVRESDRPLEHHRDAGDPADPGGSGLHVREDGVRAPARLGGVRGDVLRLRGRHRRQPARGAARFGGATRVRCQHHPGQRPVGRQHGRQGGSVRPGEHRDLDGRDERRLERLGQRRLRRADARRRSCAARQPVPRRGDLRRRRLGPVRDVLLHRDRGLHSRAHGREERRSGSGRRSRRERSRSRPSVRSSCRRWCSR